MRESFEIFCLSFISLFIQGIPFLLLGSFIGPLALKIFSAHRWIKFLPQKPSLAIPLGLLAATLIPSCECIAIPMTYRFIKKGIPRTTALTYLFASPVLNPVCIISTAIAFNANHPLLVTLFRISGAIMIAIALSILLPIFSKKIWNTDLSVEENSFEKEDSWAETFHHSISDFLNVSFYYLIGSGLASLFHLLPIYGLFSSETFLATPTLMLVSFIISVCSSSDAFIANSFLAYPLVSKLAFLWLGALLDLKLIFTYQILFNKKTVLLLIVLIPVLVLLLSYGLQPFLGKF